MSPFQSDGSSGPLRTPAALASLDEDRTTHVESAPRGAFGTASLRKGLPKLPQSARSISGRALRASIESVEAFFLWPQPCAKRLEGLSQISISQPCDCWRIGAVTAFLLLSCAWPVYQLNEVHDDEEAWVQEAMQATMYAFAPVISVLLACLLA
eukprot:scaffold1741_cov262-Pinguiococcus_pyrenoidosus.AAC.29